VDKLRLPYARTDSEFQRRTVFAASVNPEEFLQDETGNLRWWVLPVTR
jgi:putative DNA primase/helicase